MHLSSFNPVRLFAPVRPLPDTAQAYAEQLDHAMAVFVGPDRYSAMAHAIAIWAVRRLGASRASTFADAVVKGVQFASREGVE